MSEFSEFWESKTRQLADDYCDESGRGAESCSLLALELARILTSEGKRPSILSLTGVKVDSVNTAPLVPRPYEGRVRWGGHTVCVADGVVYDPMLAAPEPWETYPEVAFGVDVIARNHDWLLENLPEE